MRTGGMSSDENVVERLASCFNEARKIGFNVRMEVFDDEQAGWCVIGGVPTLFVDLSQAAPIQLKRPDRRSTIPRCLENPSPSVWVRYSCVSARSMPHALAVSDGDHCSDWTLNRPR